MHLSAASMGIPDEDEESQIVITCRSLAPSIRKPWTGIRDDRTIGLAGR